MMNLVEIRCYKCGGVLKTIASAPESWSGVVSFLRCGKCDRPDPSRIVDVLIASGAESFALTGLVKWRTLRPLVEKAWRTGKTQSFHARVVNQRFNS